MESLLVSLPGQSILIFLAYLASAVLLFLISFFILSKGLSKSSNIFFFLSSLFLTLFLLGRAFSAVFDTFSGMNWLFLSELMVLASLPFTLQTLFSSFPKTRVGNILLYFSYIWSFALIAAFLFVPRVIGEKIYYTLFFASFPSNIDIVSSLLFFSTLILIFYSSAYALIRKPYINRVTKRQFWSLWFFFLFFYAVIFALVLPFWNAFVSFAPPELFVLSVLLLLISLFRYELFGVKIPTSHSPVSALAIFSVTLLVALLNFYAKNILSHLPLIPVFVFPAVSIFAALFLGWFVWWREKRTDELKAEFTNVVTHQFRTPLTYIKWSIDELKKEQTEVERKASINQIEAGNERLVELVNILVGISKTDELFSYAWTAVSPRELVEESLSHYGTNLRQKNISLVINLANDLPLLAVDTNRLKLVVSILLENAIAYTPEHGYISVSAVKKEHSVLFAFRDTGIGISKEDMPHIFKNFYRSKDAQAVDMTGMGLGLYIAKSIIERHGGKIWAESEGRGKGATFFFELKF
ncbi:MAG: HAMP domain-containing sensor histidine kinase [Candidatus Pacebacteria bacterium]|nr:HAMP domain-containing sensor histidine kinase [Candidatus Paceibacterota bacterium]